MQTLDDLSLKKKYKREDHGDRYHHPGPPLLLPSGQVLAGFASLFQGDHLGVEYALRGHQSLLESVGLLDKCSIIQGHRPFPTGPTWQGLVIDDFFSVSCEDAEEDPMLADSVRCWQTAKEAYRRDSVLGSDEKDIVGSDHFQIIGAEVNSSKRNLSNGVCSVGAPTPKRLALISLTLKAAALPVMSRALASRLTGNWTSVLMFRRCLTCVLDKIYSFGVGDASEADEVLLLPRRVAQELVLASVLGLVAVSNVAVDYLPTIFATDASMSKGAVCSREVSPEVAELVWLGGDKRGCYTKLDPPFRALRRALGDFDEEEGIIHEDLPSSTIQKPLEFVFDFVEVCGGSGVVSSAMAKLGHIVCTPIDLDRSSHFDLLKLHAGTLDFAYGQDPQV